MYDCVEFLPVPPIPPGPPQPPSRVIPRANLVKRRIGNNSSSINLSHPDVLLQHLLPGAHSEVVNVRGGEFGRINRREN